MQNINLTNPDVLLLRAVGMHVFLQLTRPHIEPSQVDNDADKNGRDDRYDNPYFTIGPEPVGHFNAIGNRLLGQQRLAV